MDLFFRRTELSTCTPRQSCFDKQLPVPNFLYTECEVKIAKYVRQFKLTFTVTPSRNSTDTHTHLTVPTEPQRYTCCTRHSQASGGPVWGDGILLLPTHTRTRNSSHQPPDVRAIEESVTQHNLLCEYNYTHHIFVRSCKKHHSMFCFSHTFVLPIVYHAVAQSMHIATKPAINNQEVFLLHNKHCKLSCKFGMFLYGFLFTCTVNLKYTCPPVF